MGLQQRWEMDPAKRPIVPGIRFAGIAQTAEYRSIDAPLRPVTHEEFDELQYRSGPEGLWREAGPWGARDERCSSSTPSAHAGILGSNNTLGVRVRGVVGFVIDGACRDCGECILQRAPVFSTVRSPPTRWDDWPGCRQPADRLRRRGRQPRRPGRCRR